jgi:hypothetical protein
MSMAWYQQLNSLLHPLAHPASANRPRPPRSSRDFSRAINQGHPHYVMGPDAPTELTLVATGSPPAAILQEVYARAHGAGFGRLRSVGPGGIHSQFPPVPLDMSAENAYNYARRLTGPGPILLITDGSQGWPHRLGPDRILVTVGPSPPQLRGYIVSIPISPAKDGPEGP